MYQAASIMFSSIVLVMVVREMFTYFKEVGE